MLKLYSGDRKSPHQKEAHFVTLQPEMKMHQYFMEPPFALITALSLDTSLQTWHTDWAIFANSCSVKLNSAHW